MFGVSAMVVCTTVVVLLFSLRGDRNGKMLEIQTMLLVIEALKLADNLLNCGVFCCSAF